MGRQLDELNATLEAIGGCGDGDCKVYVRPGIHTNGGCRCLYRNDGIKAQRVIGAYRRYVRACEAALPDTPSGVTATDTGRNT